MTGKNIPQIFPARKTFDSFFTHQIMRMFGKKRSIQPKSSIDRSTFSFLPASQRDAEPECAGNSVPHYGVRRFGPRKINIASLIVRPSSSIVRRSMPKPKPPCGGQPYLKNSR